MKTYTDDVRVRYKTFCRAINKKQAVTTSENWMQALPAGRSDRIRTCGILLPKNLGVPVSACF